MYEELVKRLRDISNSDSNIKSNYIGLTMMQAADAIEELSREIDIDNAAMTAMDELRQSNTESLLRLLARLA